MVNFKEIDHFYVILGGVHFTTSYVLPWKGKILVAADEIRG
jgi:hypothetical protein